MTARTLRSLKDLEQAGLLLQAPTRDLQRVAEKYAIGVTAEVAKLIEAGNPSDPIALQYLPKKQELDIQPQETADPIGDKKHTPVEGIVHRYANRVLLKAVHICPVYCRFCFRREMVGPGKEPALTSIELAKAIAYIQSKPDIEEVIVTGGDPFILAPHKIQSLTCSLSGIKHVRKIRWHTRVPVVSPALITSELIQALAAPSREVIVAVHANHPREFTREAKAAIQAIADEGASLLSQSVLLRGVNDDARTMTELLQAFVECGVTPYYLHHADLAPGTAHFRTSIASGLDLMKYLRAHLASQRLPTYVLDIPGGYTKVNLESSNCVHVSARRWRLKDDTGTWHNYEESLL